MKSNRLGLRSDSTVLGVTASKLSPSCCCVGTPQARSGKRMPRRSRIIPQRRAKNSRQCLYGRPSRRSLRPDPGASFIESALFRAGTFGVSLKALGLYCGAHESAAHESGTGINSRHQSPARRVQSRGSDREPHHRHHAGQSQREFLERTHARARRGDGCHCEPLNAHRNTQDRPLPTDGDERNRGQTTIKP